MQQIAVRRVNLDYIEARSERAARDILERLPEPLDAGGIDETTIRLGSVMPRPSKAKKAWSHKPSSVKTRPWS